MAHRNILGQFMPAFFLIFLGATLFFPINRQVLAATHTPAASPTPTARLVWVGRLISNTRGVTEGQGSIFRVSVQGILDTPIELRNGDQIITAKSGSKPEYGPFAAEFAPVMKSTWTVSVPAIGASLQVEADNYNMAVIEFGQVPVSAATPPTATPTATPLGATNWSGQKTGEVSGGGVSFARLLVTVAGRDAQPVQLATLTQVVNTANTGQKPAELGPNTVEFTGLTPGWYIIDPLGLNASFKVELKPNIETRVEFKPAATLTATLPVASATTPPPTVTPLPPTATNPLPTHTPPPAPATPTPTPTPPPTAPPTATATPIVAPTPVTRWLGVVDRRTATNGGSSSMAVKVTGIEGLAVRLNRTDSDLWPEQRCLTGENNQPQDTCTFKNLPQGWYTINPEGVPASLPLQLGASEAVQVMFNVEKLPPGITGWQVKENQNTNLSMAQPKTEGVIRVKVMGQPGQIVSLHSIRLNTIHYCETTHNPVLGAPICEFGRLGPGVYQVEALHTGAEHRLFVDGAGLAELEFAPNATYATQPMQPVFGAGARPRSITPTVTATTPPIVTPAARAIPPTATPTSTVMLTATVAISTPAPAPAWQAQVVERVTTGAGAIGVRVVGLKDHLVILHSGSWQSQPQPTGTKPELGDFATEFGGLPPAEYLVELVGLAQYKVVLGGGEFALVEFRYK